MSSLDPDLIGRRMYANVRRCPALFAQKPDYVPSLLAPFGAITSLSSERNGRQQIICLNDESFSVALRIDAKKKPVLGEMLGDAVRPALCV